MNFVLVHKASNGQEYLLNLKHVSYITAVKDHTVVVLNTETQFEIEESFQTIADAIHIRMINK